MRVKVRNVIRLKIYLSPGTYLGVAKQILSIIEPEKNFRTQDIYIDDFDKGLVLVHYGFDNTYRIKQVRPGLWMVRKIYCNKTRPDGVCYIKENWYVEPVEPCPV